LKKTSLQQILICNRLIFQQLTHTPAIARGFSLIDSQETYWKNGYCPYRIKKNGLTGSTNVIERVDQGATFYKKFFFGQGKTKFFFHYAC